MRIITNEKDLKGIKKMEKVKVVYPAEHLGNKYDAKGEYQFVGSLVNEDKNYFIVSLIKPSKEHKNANFVTTSAYVFQNEGIGSCYSAITGYSYKNELEQELDRHFSILTRNPEDLE